jgi:hypothetical protein
VQWKWLITYCCWLAFEIVFIYFMFPETYGRTLEELAFLFEDRARAEEATSQVEKQMEWVERRFSRVDERMSWEMDVIIPSNEIERHDRGGRVEGRDTRRGDWWDG